MMRTLIALISLVVTLGLSSAATATSLTVDTDKKTYLSGETITVTTTLVVMADHSIQNQLLLQLLWSDPQIAGIPGPTSVAGTLFSFGVLDWTPGAGMCLSASCLVLDQLAPVQPAGSAPDAGTLIMTTTMVADAVGLINFAFGTVIGVDATPTFGGNAATAEVTIIPEPGTAALLGLGLSGLAVAGRRRNA